MSKNKTNKKGFAVIMTLLLVISLVLVVSFSITIIIINENQIDKNLVLSAQSYYSAESGIEDGLLRVMNNDYKYASSNNFNFDGSAVSQDITQTGNSTIIESRSSYQSNERKVKTELTITTDDISFHYGVQVGEGGLVMGNNSSIIGNLYSNGSVTGSGTITGDIVVVTEVNGLSIEGNAHAHEIRDCDIDGNAYAKTIEDSEIIGEAHYETFINSTAGSEFADNPDDPLVAGLPISDSNIDGWKADAVNYGNLDASLCDISTDVTINGGVLDCDFNPDAGIIITLKGTMWVKGNITFGNNTILVLDSDYGDNSGIIIADNFGNELTSGKILVENNVIICGSQGLNVAEDDCDVPNETYILILSTHSGLGTNAIEVRNNASGAIFYAHNGTAHINNNADLKEVTAYKLSLENLATVTYESGLADASFTSGPGGGWLISNWNEIQ